MMHHIPFVKRETSLIRRGGYSTAISAKYNDYSGLYDNHGQHTMILTAYE